MTRTLNTSTRRAIVRAYFEGMSLISIKELFKVSYADTIAIVHKYLLKGPT